MKFVQVDRKDVVKKRKNSNIRLLIEEFIKSDMDICELVFAEGEYKNARVCASTWNASIKRYGYLTAHAFTRNGHAYIERVKP